MLVTNSQSSKDTAEHFINDPMLLFFFYLNASHSVKATKRNVSLSVMLFRTYKALMIGNNTHLHFLNTTSLGVADINAATEDMKTVEVKLSSTGLFYSTL